MGRCAALRPVLTFLASIQLGLIRISISQVDFQDVNARTLAERKREEEKQRRLDRIYRERSEQAVREMEGESPGPGRGEGRQVGRDPCSGPRNLSWWETGGAL